MKKLASLILALGLTASSVLADEPCQKTTTTGNTAFTGFVTATNLNPAFEYLSGSGPFNFFAGGSSTQAFSYLLSTNIRLEGTAVNTIGASPTFALAQIYGFSVQCAPYNPVLAATPPYNYPYTTETNGVSGGTITVHEYKLVGSTSTVGTVVLPNSPHGGPYVNTATSTLLAPYTPTSGSMFDAQVTAEGSDSQYYQFCVVTAVLQGSN